MSRLHQTAEEIKCEGCDTKMAGYEVTFCRTVRMGKKKPSDKSFERCNRVTCPVCEYCSWCQIRINTYVKKIKSYKQKNDLKAFENEKADLYLDCGFTYKDNKSCNNSI